MRLRVFGLAAALGLAACSGPDDEVISRELAAVRASLKDPDSAQFSGVRRSEKDQFSVCGLVNARNSFGGYTGPTRFVSSTGVAIIDPGDNPMFDDLWARRC